MHNNTPSRFSPWTYPVFGFAVIIAVGTLALMILPCLHEGHIGVVNALFMATSAACVTGLSVFSIGDQFTLVGQIVILLLIQVGGLGIMTFSTVFLIALGRSLSFRSRIVLQESFSHSPRADLTLLIRNVVLFTLLFEAVGTVLFFIAFRPRFGWQTALYQAVFHSVSGFCNAGFSLFADSLTAYRTDALLNLSMAGLIVVGGLGFVVLHELYVYALHALRGKLERKRHRLSLHSKIVLCCSGLLLAGGTLMLLAAEWSGTLAGLGIGGKILTAFFQSVTARTAGFNTVDCASLANVSVLVMMLLMFVGASPGSCGGGVKTTTMGTLAALARARLKGYATVHLFHRTLPEAAVRRVLIILAVSMAIVVFATALLLVTEADSAWNIGERARFVELLFETVSAYGTVGLSMGATPTLSPWGRLLLTLVMFTGRLGPLVLATAVHVRRSGAEYSYAEEPVMIG